jgi:hypothetical protein
MIWFLIAVGATEVLVGPMWIVTVSGCLHGGHHIEIRE